MSGTVTGKDCNLFLCAHAGGATLAAITTLLSSRGHSVYGVGDFSLTLDKGTVEQQLIGQVGNYFDQGALSMDGSFTLSQFGASGLADSLANLLDTTSAGTYRYLAISGCVSDSTDEVYLSWFLVSCQVTGYDISMGDADTITTASVDFTVMDPFAVDYDEPCINDCA